MATFYTTALSKKQNTLDVFAPALHPLKSFCDFRDFIPEMSKGHFTGQTKPPQTL